MKTWIWLSIIFLVALGLRFSHQSGTFDGSDSFYELRHLQHVLATGKDLGFDKALNYPQGLQDPDPPLWVWMTSPFAKWNPEAALSWSGSILGALATVPVFFIGRDLFGRKSGLWASSLTALSSPLIERTSFEFPKHDAAAIFFVLLGIAFLVRALIVERGRVAWACLSGVSLSACALCWKGYPLALATVGIACILSSIGQRVSQQPKSVTPFLICLVISTIVPFIVYYRLHPDFIGSTVFPSLAILVSCVAVSILLAATRRIPISIVGSGLAISSLAWIPAVIELLPGPSKSVLDTGYFSQSPLYSTILEAQHPSLPELAAALGFGSLLVAFWAIPQAMSTRRSGVGLILAFLAVTLALSLSARRFLPWAALPDVILAGVGVSRLVESLRKGWSPRKALSLACLALLVPIPALASGIQASRPTEPQIEAFGWAPAMQALSSMDSFAALESRPGVLAWWDYGHWIIEEGRHPAVADPFQDHFGLVSSFFTAQSENQSEDLIRGMGIGYLVVDYRMEITNSSAGIFFAPAILSGHSPNEFFHEHSGRFSATENYTRSMYARAWLHPDTLRHWTVIWKSDKVEILEHRTHGSQPLNPIRI